MKKKISLLLAAAMVASLVPMTAFAKTDNRVTNTVQAGEDTILGTASLAAPKLIIEGDDLENISTPTDVSFELKLANAKWDGLAANDFTITSGGSGAIVINDISDTTKIITIENFVGGANAKIEIDLVSELTSEGDATVTIDPRNSVLSADTLKFATVVAGETSTTVADTTDIREGTAGSEMDTIVIEETTAGVITPGDEIRIKLTKGFEFANTESELENQVINLFGFGAASINVIEIDENEMIFEIVGSASTQPGIISLLDLKVRYDEDDVEAGDVCEMTISGGGIDKQTIELGTAVTYGVTAETENEELPVFVAGRYQDDQEDEALQITFKETIPTSWLEDRTTEITFPEGVKIDLEDEYVAVEGGDYIENENTSAVDTVEFVVEQKEDYSVLKLKADRVGGADEKAEILLDLPLSIDASFEGDVVVTFSGSGIEEDLEVAIATVIPAVEVEADVNELSIDYRKVGASDIIITETQAENLMDDKTLVIGLDGGMTFDGTPTVEVIEGDLELNDAEISGGNIEISIDSASQKTPGVIKVSDVELFLERSLPAGSYELALRADGGNGDAIFDNYVDDTTSSPAAGAGFETDEIVVLEDYVEVVTAGSDQGEGTFTTTISVVIGANTMMVGAQEIALDVPAFISEGYTMLPVRAVTEALTGAATVRWDDTTKTVTISMASRIVNMQVGSTVMNINGVPVQMSKACEIVDGRAFIALRDLGYALGLTDDKIVWDDATKTASLN